MLRRKLKFIVIWSDSRIRSNLDEINCYLVRLQALQKIEVTVIWLDSRLRSNLDEINCYLVGFQAS